MSNLIIYPCKKNYLIRTPAKARLLHLSSLSLDRNFFKSPLRPIRFLILPVCGSEVILVRRRSTGLVTGRVRLTNTKVIWNSLLQILVSTSPNNYQHAGFVHCCIASKTSWPTRVSNWSWCCECTATWVARRTKEGTTTIKQWNGELDNGAKISVWTFYTGRSDCTSDTRRQTIKQD